MVRPGLEAFITPRKTVQNKNWFFAYKTFSAGNCICSPGGSCTHSFPSALHLAQGRPCTRANASQTRSVREAAKEKKTLSCVGNQPRIRSAEPNTRGFIHSYLDAVHNLAGLSSRGSGTNPW